MGLGLRAEADPLRMGRPPGAPVRSYVTLVCHNTIERMIEQVRQPRELSFAHQSEAEFARFLDFYEVEWRYESVCFPVLWDSSGRVREAFTPDFYLPEFDLYVELTTMKQSLVTRKNRKVRLMKELYPDVRLKILYNRDYRKLLFKFGAI